MDNIQQRFKDLLKMSRFERWELKTWIRHQRIKQFLRRLFCIHKYSEIEFTTSGTLPYGLPPRIKVCDKCGKVKNG